MNLGNLQDRIVDSLSPKQGSQWLHKKGNKYTVLLLANMDGDRGYDAEFPPTVVYKGEDGRVWSRPLDRWYGSFTQLQPCRSPYCECEVGACTHPGFYDARGE